VGNLFLDQLVSSQRYRWIVNGHRLQTIINAGTLWRGHTPGFAAFDQMAITFWDLTEPATVVRGDEIALSQS
jgi:hypothetical protein